MPLFDFHCSACGNDFETLVRSGDTPVCPECQSAALERCLSRISPAGKIDELRRRKCRGSGKLRPVRSARHGFFLSTWNAEPLVRGNQRRPGLLPCMLFGARPHGLSMA